MLWLRTVVARGQASGRLGPGRGLAAAVASGVTDLLRTCSFRTAAVAVRHELTAPWPDLTIRNGRQDLGELGQGSSKAAGEASTCLPYGRRNPMARQLGPCDDRCLGR